MKRLIVAGVAALSLLTLSACDDAKVASENLSKAADNFEIQRRVVFFNGITDKYLLEITGLCAVEDEGNQLEVTCKVGKGKNEVKKHFLGLSDNVSYFIEQTEGAKVDFDRYRVTFKPEVIVPDIDLRVNEGDKGSSL
jgi:hypothetical protein